MYPRRCAIRLHLTPQQAEFIYWELAGLLSQYTSEDQEIEPADEAALQYAVSRLETGLEQARSIAELQLQQLRRINQAALSQ